MKGPTAQQEEIYWSTLATICRVTIALLGLAVMALLVFLIGLIGSVLIPLALAAIIACWLHPVLVFMERWKIKRTAGLMILAVISVSVTLLTAVLLIPLLYNQSAELLRSVPGMMDQVRLAADDLLQNNAFLRERFDALQEHLRIDWQVYLKNIGEFAWSSITGVFGAFGFLMGFFFLPFYVFYLLKETETIKKKWTEFIPLKKSRLRNEVQAILTEINGYLILYFRGQILVAIAIGVLTSLGLLLIGLDYALLIGTAAGVLSLIPYFGLVISLVPAAVVSLLQGGLSLFAAAMGVYVVVQVIEGTLITPQIMGNRTGLHPMAIMLSFLVWTIFLGPIFGAVLAVPLAATIKVLLKRYVWHGNDEAPSSAISPG